MRRAEPLNSSVSCHFVNRFTNIALLVTVAAASIAVQEVFISPRFAMSETSKSFDAEVVSIEMPATDEKKPRVGRAVLKLASGQMIRAIVPGGCLVLPGQTTRVANLGSSYMVVANGK